MPIHQIFLQCQVQYMINMIIILCLRQYLHNYNDFFFNFGQFITYKSRSESGIEVSSLGSRRTSCQWIQQIYAYRIIYHTTIIWIMDMYNKPSYAHLKWLIQLYYKNVCCVYFLRVQVCITTFIKCFRFIDQMTLTFRHTEVAIYCIKVYVFTW